MYYDEYECLHGDGFYPCMEPEEGFHEINLTFMLYKQTWVQHPRSKYTIFGLDGNNGIKLLQYLNQSVDESESTSIYNSNMTKIY
jgi:hypothetical protein